MVALRAVPRDEWTAATQRVAELTADLARAVADLARVQDDARARLAADERLAYDLADAANAVGVSRQTIERWTRERPNPLPFSRIAGGQKLVLARDLLRFVEDHRVN